MFLRVATVTLFLVGLCYGVPHRRKGWIGAAWDPLVPFDPYIVGGETVKGREYPSQISLRVEGSHNCGGTILNSEWIMTAGHCGQGYMASELTVFTGSNLLNEGGSRHQVKEIIVHENFNPEEAWKNDICVMKVSPPIVLENGTEAVALETNQQDPADGEPATVVGWGRVSAGGIIPNDLRKAVIPIVDRQKCQKDYASDDEQLHDTQVCAGGGGDKDACNGDSGGPLFVKNKQVGIVSWGRPCAVLGYPTVFTDVSKYIDWISKHTK